MRSHSAFCPSSPCQFHYSPPSIAIAPAHPVPPRSSLSPSELDYAYVKAALSVWPSYYTSSVFALHTADGIGIIWSTWAPGCMRTRAGRTVYSFQHCCHTCTVLMGLVKPYIPLYPWQRGTGQRSPSALCIASDSRLSRDTCAQLSILRGCCSSNPKITSRITWHSAVALTTVSRLISAG